MRFSAGHFSGSPRAVTERTYRNQFRNGDATDVTSVLTPRNNQIYLVNFKLVMVR